MDWSVVMNYVLGGGVLALLIGVMTLKAKVRKANAEAEQANGEAEKSKAEAETVRIDNAGNATRILIENIVEPLKKELSETREELREIKKEFGSTKREMARLRKAIDTAGGCAHRDECPVLDRLREQPKGTRREESSVRRPAGQFSPRDSPERGSDGGDTGKCRETDDTGVEPP